MKGHRSFPFGTVAALDNKYRHSTLTFFFFFFFLRGGNLHGHQVVVPDSNRLKPPR